jgi:putative MFS transporter
MLLPLGMATPLGWRTMFLIGGVPLLFLPLLAAFLKETPVFRATRSGGTGLRLLEQLRLLSGPKLRARFLIMSLYWFLLNFGVFAAGVFFTTYLVQERGWTAADVGLLGPAILVSTFIGSIASGFLLDRIGRRLTISLLLMMLGVAAQVTYAATDPLVIGVSWIMFQFAVGIWSASFTLTSELFPTNLRATANGVCNNLIGRWGMVAAPAAAGLLVGPLGGFGPSIFWLAMCVYAVVPLVWLLSETRGIPLD